MPAKAKWTVLTYIAAHNNLGQLGQLSRNEIVAVGSTGDVRHGVMYDGPGGGARYVIGAPNSAEDQDLLYSFDSGDPDSLIETTRWLFDKYPADRYGLVLWSHGTGWAPDEVEQVAIEARPGAGAEKDEAKQRSTAPGSLVLFRSTLRSLLTPAQRSERAILFDDGTGHSLDTLELARVTRTIRDAIGGPLEFLGMDACLMANVEVAWELRDCARYLVASEELVPGHSWPYREVYSGLRDDPGQGGETLSCAVVKHYVDFFTKNPPGAGDVTKVAVDLTHLAALGEACQALATALRGDMAKHAGIVWQVQADTRQRETRDEQRTMNKFQYHLWDLGAFASGLAAATSASSAVRTAAGDVVRALASGAGAVLAEGHVGNWFDGIGGLSVYLIPPGAQQIARSYSELAFSKDTGWGDMLAAYHASARGR